MKIGHTNFCQTWKTLLKCMYEPNFIKIAAVLREDVKNSYSEKLLKSY